MTARKGAKRSSAKGKGLGHFAVSTEESRHHEASEKKRQTIAKAHKQEYSADHSHSMSHVEMFRSHAGTKNHQRDLRKAEQHMGISVKVQRNVKAALKEQERAEKEAVPKREKRPVNLRVNTSSPSTKGLTNSRPYSLSSPRVKSSPMTLEQKSTASSPTRSSTVEANVVKYHATEAGGRLATAERILNEQMIRLKSQVIQIHARRTSHDDGQLALHAHGRAANIVKAELNDIIAGLDKVQGPAVQNKYTAISTMFVRLNHELEDAVFTDEHLKRKHIAYEEQRAHADRERQLDAYFRDLATKDQRLNQLERDLALQVETNENLARTNEALSKELEMLNRNQQAANQNAVELRMQGLDFKARVENRLNRVLHSIQTRMGFVPAGITKEIRTLNSLKAPGDPSYNDVLHRAYTKNSLKKMQKMLGDIPAISGMFDEDDVLVDPYTGKMTLLDGTVVADKTEAEKQEAKDRLRMTGYSPARAKSQRAHHIPSPSAAESQYSSANTSSMGDKEINGNELIESGQHSKSLLPPRSSEGAREIAGRLRPPRSQEEWVQWALNKTSSDLPSSLRDEDSKFSRAKDDKYWNRKGSMSSSVWVEPGTEDDSESGDDGANVGEVEVAKIRDFADDMDDEEDSDYEPSEDLDEEGEILESDDDYVREKATAVQRGGFYELESVSTQDVDDVDLQSYEAGKSRTIALLANNAGSSTYIDPRASVRSSVSSFGDPPPTLAWTDTAEDSTKKLSPEDQLTETAAELQDIKAFLSHVRTQRGIAEAELQAFMKK